MSATVAVPTQSKLKPDPFAPMVTHDPSISDSSQIVVLPLIPELLNPNFFDSLLPPQPPKAKDPPPLTNAFMTALREDVGNRMLTENESPAYRSTLSATLDLFSSGGYLQGSVLHPLLKKSWEEDPAITLRIIYHLRSIHDGKSEKKGFYMAFGWLFQNHPRTAIANLSQLVEPIIDRPPKKKKKETTDSDWTEVDKEDADDSVEVEYRAGFSHGYYKDLLNILLLAASDELTKPNLPFTGFDCVRPLWTYEGDKPSKAHRWSSGSKLKQQQDSSPRLTKRQKRALRTSPPETHAQLKAKRAQATYDDLSKKLISSPEFRALFISVARIFASKLSEEIAILKQLTDPNSMLSDEERKEFSYKIGLVSKWAPTLGGSHDRMTNIATAISIVLLSQGAMPELRASIDLNQPLSKAAADKIRGYYRRWIVGPLRRQSHIPEIFMSAQQWDKINYSRVPSLCMSKSKGIFFKHDAERFSMYVQDVAAGKRKITGAVLGPHDTLVEAIQLSNDKKITAAEKDIRMRVLDAQFNSLVERLRESGSLNNCLALCDVSGSMGYIDHPQSSSQPIFPAIALSILTAQLALPPFNNIFITFSQNPEVVQIDPSKGLAATAREMASTSWGMNTDLQAVFLKLLLPLAKKHNVKKEDMVKRLFIFSDMQFDDCRGARYGNGQQDSDWVTDHDMIVRQYAEAGYDVPEIVYWNLDDDEGSKPVTASQNGVALVSGFSGNLLKIFMDGDEELRRELEELEVVENDGSTKAEKPEMNPIDVMLKALLKKSFDGLKVLD
ncbi:uncharacterized protein EI90DRAFT_3011918 [Cantharellus anzutake]|uniref:uncharacterized protein n=1 Tax=Cantharellus anzutake TaxID=1750568 RepID=UPI001908D52B|nr:uncharacterized protein EI90DRAFT_3011918 [Cantharellus anzutake]KAF8341290.1 hypothetical protein EI90DRAFT_3011918 [Cantharellus anzutake]